MAVDPNDEPKPQDHAKGLQAGGRLLRRFLISISSSSSHPTRWYCQASPSAEWPDLLIAVTAACVCDGVPAQTSSGRRCRSPPPSAPWGPPNRRPYPTSAVTSPPSSVASLVSLIWYTAQSQPRVRVCVCVCVHSTPHYWYRKPRTCPEWRSRSPSSRRLRSKRLR